MSPGPHAHTLARWWTLGAGAALVAIAWIGNGTGAALGSAVGAVLVVLFLSSGLAALRLFGREDVPGGMGLVVYLLSYALRLVVVLFAAVAIVRFAWVDAEWLGMSMVVCAIVWVGAHVLGAWRRAGSEPIVEPERGDERDES